MPENEDKGFVFKDRRKIFSETEKEPEPEPKKATVPEELSRKKSWQEEAPLPAHCLRSIFPPLSFP